MNRMEAVADLFGLNLYDEFKVKEFSDSYFRFTTESLQYKPHDNYDKWINIPKFLNDFIIGKYTIIRTDSNVYQDAFESLNLYCYDVECGLEPRIKLDNQLKVLNELVKKSIATPLVEMKAIDGNTLYRCPNCYGVLNNPEITSYCPYCGQKIDDEGRWEDAEEE